MSLDDFLNKFSIDRTALGCIQKRVFIVGRFNQQAPGAEPGMYLFTNRAVSSRFRQNFNAVAALNYENFVDALSPTIAEVIEPISKRYSSVRQIIPSSVKDAQGTSVIDQFNYFFQRAIANSEQPAFKSSSPPQTPQLLGGQAAGREILKQIRRNLTAFCTFQPRTHELIAAMEQLLEQCAGYRGIPGAYSAGATLPGGFAEILVDFIYDENTSRSFKNILGFIYDENKSEWIKKTAGRLDFAVGAWSALETDQPGQLAFAEIVDAFRDRLVNGNADNFAGIRFGTRQLKDMVKERVDDSLRDDFTAARAGYNGLRQILRSKVLLSMVLQWLTSSLMEIPSVAAEKVSSKKFLAASTAILENFKANNLAPAKRRPSPEERVRFADLLIENFERLLTAIVTDDEGLSSQKLQDLDPRCST